MRRCSVLTEKTVADYINVLAARTPTPGGGGAAALAAALGAALNSMVANFTIGNKKYADVEEDVKMLLGRSEEMRVELVRLIDADSEAYGECDRARQMPRETPEQKAERQKAVQEALKGAAEVPMRVAQLCDEVLELSSSLVDKGNVYLISDVGVAVRMAEAALHCAALNVEINLAYIEDEDYNSAKRASLEPLLARAETIREEVWNKVKQKMAH